MIICEVSYSFSLLDVGQYGNNNDCGVLNNSGIINDEEMNMPQPKSFFELLIWSGAMLFSRRRNISFKNMVYEAIPWTAYKRTETVCLPSITQTKRIIENCFRILVAWRRIFHTPTVASIENAEESLVK